MNNEKNSNNWWDIEKKPQNLDIPVVNNGVSQTPVKEQNTQNITNEVIPEIKGMENTITNSNNTEEDLMRAFIGKNLEKFANPFNFAAFFFGSTYYYYRKMILYGIIITIIETLLTTIFGIYIIATKDIFSILIIPGLVLLFRLFLGAVTNRIYYHFVKTKVKNIQANDFKYNIGNVKEECIKKGGRSLVYAILFGMALNYAVTLPFNSINNIISKISEISTNYVQNYNNNN